MSDPSSASISDLLNRIANHRWTRAEIAWESLGRVYRAYQRNAVELLMVITDPQRDPDLALKIMSEDQAEHVRDLYYDELFRQLLNYLASISTLIDLSRNHMQPYQTSTFGSEYKNRTLTIKDLPVAAFIKRLRNYLLHHRFPPPGVSLILSDEPSASSFTVTLNRDTLLKGGGWNKEAKAYIRSKDPLILQEAVEEYATAIEGLYEWLFEQFTVVHQHDLIEVNRLKTEARELLS